MLSEDIYISENNYLKSTLYQQMDEHTIQEQFSHSLEN